MSGRSLFGVLLLGLFVGVFGCGSSDSNSGSVEDETIAMLAAGETASWVLRLVAAAVSDPLDWSGTEAKLEQDALQRVESTLGRIRCIKFDRSEPRSLELTFEACNPITRGVEGSAVFVVDADFAAPDPRIEIDIDLPKLSWRDGEFRGGGSLSTSKSTFGRFEGGLHIHHTGVITFDFEADGHFETIKELELLPCIKVNALGIVQSRSASVAISFNDALYCAGRCGRAGAVTGAGRYLQKLRFSESSATREINDGPADDLQSCSSR